MENKLQTPTKCSECDCETFYIEELYNTDTKGDYCCGVLYQCTSCGYIHTAWRD